MNMLALLNLGVWEIILILAVLLLLFGAARLPKLGKGLGQSIKEFRGAARELSEGEPADVKKEDRKHSTPGTPTRHG